MAFLTLSLEATGSLAFTKPFLQPASTLADWILPLRCTVGGKRIHPVGLDELAALDPAWRGVQSTPDRYAMVGWNLMAMHPLPALGATVSVTYAKAPTTLSTDEQEPEVSEEYHEALADGAIYLIRLKEGSGELEAEQGRLRRFLDDAAAYAQIIRARAVQRGYDTLPSDRWFRAVKEGKWPLTSAK